MKPLSQIPFSFATEEEVATPAIATVLTEKPVNIGVRIKALKTVLPVEEKKVVAIVPEEKVKSTRGRKSLKQFSAEADLVNVPEDDILFQKQYYAMGEVAEMFHVNQSLLRFWEAEFDIIQPRKNKKGDRHFRPVDIKNLHLIYHLLRERKYTIEGAKEFLKKNKKAEQRFESVKKLQQIKDFLLELRAQI